MNPEIKALFKSFFVEFLVYATLVVGYFLLVLHFLGDWLNKIFIHERKTYAVMALTLVVVQGLVLEKVTRVLLRLLGKDKESAR